MRGRTKEYSQSSISTHRPFILRLTITTEFHDQRSTTFYSPISHTRHSESPATHTTPGADHRPRLICPVKKNRTCRSQLHPTTTPAKCGTFSPSTRRVGVASGEFVASWDMQALSSGFDRGDTDAAKSYYDIPGGLGGTSTTFDLSTNRGYWPASGRCIHRRRVVITFSSSAKAAFGHSAHSWSSYLWLTSRQPSSSLSFDRRSRTRSPS